MDGGGQTGADGSVELTDILTGPEALTGRLGTFLRPVAKRILHGRFETSIPLTELKTKGLDRGEHSEVHPGQRLPCMEGARGQRAHREEEQRVSPQARKVRVADLVGSRIVDSDGRIIGRVADLVVTYGPPYRLTAILSGGWEWLDRLPDSMPQIVLRARHAATIYTVRRELLLNFLCST